MLAYPTPESTVKPGAERSDAEVIAVSHVYGLPPEAVGAMARGDGPKRRALGRLVADLPSARGQRPYRSGRQEAAFRRARREARRRREWFLFWVYVLLVSLLLCAGVLFGVGVAEGAF